MTKNDAKNLYYYKTDNKRGLALNLMNYCRKMPDTRRLAYSENTFSYELFAEKDEKMEQIIHEDEGMLIQSDVVTV